MFAGAIYCPSCGAKRARFAGGTQTAPCPACKGTLRQVAVGTTDLLECDKCNGIWVDAETFERLCADREAQAAVLHRWSTPESGVRETRVTYRPCVRCRTMMNRLNFGRLSGTIVDVCKGHGIFLDAGELHAIVSFIQSGGLERARQRQLEDLKEEEERLRSLRLGHAALDAGRIEHFGHLDPAVGLDVLKLLEYLTHR
jgi:Zn-finger nucleic acid-binding protein